MLKVPKGRQGGRADAPAPRAEGPIASKRSRIEQSFLGRLRFAGPGRARLEWRLNRGHFNRRTSPRHEDTPAPARIFIQTHERPVGPAPDSADSPATGPGHVEALFRSPLH